MIKYTLGLFICALVFNACSVKKESKDICILDFTENTIKGTSQLSKEFYVERRFLPRLIEDLISHPDVKSEIDYEDFYEKSSRNESYQGYLIQGCSDTTWAKMKMANHLLLKYDIERFDSTYFDTVYSVKLLDESKLKLSSVPCRRNGYHASKRINEPHYIDLECVKWSTICRFLLRGVLNRKTNTVEFEERVGDYDFRVPIEVFRKQGLKAYQKYLIDSIGINMSFLRIDTVNVGVYKRVSS